MKYCVSNIHTVMQSLPFILTLKIKIMENVILIDGDSLLYFEMGKDTLEEAIESLDGRLFEMLNLCKAEKYAGFLTIGKCFRYKEAKTK